MEELIKKWKEYEKHLAEGASEYFEMLKQSYVDKERGVRVVEREGVIVEVAEPEYLPRPSFVGFMDYLTDNPPE